VALAEYHTWPREGSSPPRPAKLHFNSTGSKFGMCDMAGGLTLWRFDADDESQLPFFWMQTHTKRTLDFVFLNSGSFIATAGASATTDKSNVCLWDVVVGGSPVTSWDCHSGGAHSVVYSPRHQLLVTGGKRGDMVAYDVRQRQIVVQFPTAHALNVKTLAVHPAESILASASTDGSVKIWELPSMQERTHWPDAHEKKTFVKPTTGFFTRPLSTYGVMAVHFQGNELYSVGAEGRLVVRSLTF